MNVRKRRGERMDAILGVDQSGNCWNVQSGMNCIGMGKRETRKGCLNLSTNLG